MPGVILLATAVVVNYVRDRMGLRTICQCFRAAVPRRWAPVALGAFFAWFWPHIMRGYPSKRVPSYRQFPETP